MRDQTIIKAFKQVEKKVDELESVSRYLTAALTVSGVIQSADGKAQFAEPGSFTALDALRKRGLFGRFTWLLFGR
jgi:hypothetical protein